MNSSPISGAHAPARAQRPEFAVLRDRRLEALRELLVDMSSSRRCTLLAESSCLGTRRPLRSGRCRRSDGLLASDSSFSRKPEYVVASEDSDSSDNGAASYRRCRKTIAVTVG